MNHDMHDDMIEHAATYRPTHQGFPDAFAGDGIENTRYGKANWMPDKRVQHYGDIRPESVGGPYPWAVVGIGHGDKHHYEVSHLPSGMTMWAHDQDAQFMTTDADYAGSLASLAREGRLSIGYVWKPRRTGLGWMGHGE